MTVQIWIVEGGGGGGRVKVSRPGLSREWGRERVQIWVWKWGKGGGRGDCPKFGWKRRWGGEGGGGGLYKPELEKGGEGEGKNAQMWFEEVG